MFFMIVALDGKTMTRIFNVGESVHFQSPSFEFTNYHHVHGCPWNSMDVLGSPTEQCFAKNEQFNTSIEKFGSRPCLQGFVHDNYLLLLKMLNT